MDCQKYGLDGRLQAEDGSPLGRVVAQERGLCRVVCARGELLAGVTGRFRHAAASVLDFPVTGDFVVLEPDSLEEGRGLIRGVLPRRSAFIRKASGTGREAQILAANVDLAFVCVA